MKCLPGVESSKPSELEQTLTRLIDAARRKPQALKMGFNMANSCQSRT